MVCILCEHGTGAGFPSTIQAKTESYVHVCGVDNLPAAPSAAHRQAGPLRRGVALRHHGVHAGAAQVQLLQPLPGAGYSTAARSRALAHAWQLSAPLHHPWRPCRPTQRKGGRRFACKFVGCQRLAQWLAAADAVSFSWPQRPACRCTRLRLPSALHTLPSALHAPADVPPCRRVVSELETASRKPSARTLVSVATRCAALRAKAILPVL